MKETKNYSKDPNTTSFGARLISERLAERYGAKYTDYRKMWDEADGFKLPEFPLNLVFDLTSACNLNCPQCLRASGSSAKYSDFFKGRHRLSVEDIIVVMREARRYGLPSVNIGGSGECLLHPDFIKICSLVMESGVMELRLITNGILLSRDIAGKLIDIQAPILSVSIDAFSEETYGKVRGKKDAYKTVVDNVSRFLEIRRERNSIYPLLRVTFVKQPDNAHEVSDFVEYWSECADMVDVQAFHMWDSVSCTSDFSCTEPWKRLTVWADGKIGPCCGFTGIELVVGQLGEEPLASVWNGKKINAVREMVLKKKYGKPCLQCRGSVQYEEYVEGLGIKK